MAEDMSMTNLANRARAVLPAGGFGNFEPDFFIREGRGSRVIDEDGNEFVDYLISSGPMILGHGHPEVNEAVHAQIERGMTFSRSFSTRSFSRCNSRAFFSDIFE